MGERGREESQSEEVPYRVREMIEVRERDRQETEGVEIE